MWTSMLLFIPNINIYFNRLYDAEVVEISSDVSFLMVVPPAESSCSAPGQREMLLQRPDLLPLPVQVFEMVHLGTYQKQIVSRYSRLSCILELDTALAQHSHREASDLQLVSYNNHPLLMKVLHISLCLCGFCDDHSVISILNLCIE